MKKPLLGLTLALALAACTNKAPQQQNGGISGTASLAAGVTLTGVQQAALPTSEQPADANPLAIDWNAPHVKGELLVVASADQSSSVLAAGKARGLAVQTLRQGLSKVKVPAGTDERALAEQLAAQTGAIVQPNYIYRPLQADIAPNDPYYQSSPPSNPGGETQFYLTQIDAPGAWAIQKQGATVAVLDTGAQLNHPDLTGRVAAGMDFCPSIVNNACTTPPDNDVSDIETGDPTSGHGTHTAGIIGAATNNATGIAGITWSGSLLIVKTLGADQSGAIYTDSAALSAAIKYAADNDAKVINMSLGVPTSGLGGSFNDAAVRAQIDYAHDTKGAVLVAAAGNYQPSSTTPATRPVFFPANYSKVLAVGAVDRYNNISAISAQGSEIDVWAPGQGAGFGPGQGILSTDKGSSYSYRYGTSEAAPQVSAVAALIRARNPNLTPTEVENIIRTSARPLPAQTNGNNAYGAGLLQAGAALQQVASSTPTQPVPPAQQSRTVYVYADRMINGTFQPDDPSSGKAVVVMPAGERSVQYTITQTRNGQQLKPGTYRIVACINENRNGQACDAGDIGGSAASNVNYNGAPVTGVDIVMVPRT